MLLNKKFKINFNTTENGKAGKVENSDSENKKQRLLKTKIMYILQESPNGMKQKDLLENYKKYYGEEIKPEKFGFTNMRQVFLQFPEMIHIKMTNSLELAKAFKSESDHLVFTPIKNISTYLNYLPMDIQVNKPLRVIVEGVYDPSKFWLIAKYRELQRLMDYARIFYKDERNRIKIPPNMISRNLLCILYKNGWYFRVLIINAFNYEEVQVFSIDYGKFVKCNIRGLYYIHKKFADIPRFCFRARLANICPKNSKEFWSVQSVEEFEKMLDKRTFFAKVLFIEKKHKVLHVALREFCGHHCQYLNDLLVEKQLAQYIFTAKYQTQDDTIYKTFKPLVDKLYLFPPFEVIERGLCSPSSKIIDIACQNRVLDVLFKNYVKYHTND